jgi:nucleotidyltransferase/DNA polymerase involved in DNA repair
LLVVPKASSRVSLTSRVMTPLVEPLSLDEAYLDVTDNLKEIPTAWETAKEIRARIQEEIRLTASTGISCNKFLAKIASDYRKPNGQFAILPDEAEAFVATLPIAKFHGVGPKTAASFRHPRLAHVVDIFLLQRRAHRRARFRLDRMRSGLQVGSDFGRCLLETADAHVVSGLPRVPRITEGLENSSASS